MGSTNRLPEPKGRYFNPTVSEKSAYNNAPSSHTTNARHHIGNMAMGECSFVLELLTCAVMLVACDVSGVPVVSVRRLTGCFPL
jgi:hypothetical protein